MVDQSPIIIKTSSTDVHKYFQIFIFSPPTLRTINLL